MSTAVEERDDTRIRLADGVELLGAFEGSGCQEPPHLLRRKDGQIIQVPRLLYLVASSLDHGDLDRVAERVSREFGQEVSADNVSYLIDNKLRTAGVVASGETTEIPLKRANPLLGLRLRVGIVPERAHRAITTALQPLFWPPLIWAALTGLVALDAWLFLGNGGDVIDGAGQIIYEPRLLLLLSALSILSAAFHEIGHASAARCGGAKPGAMGAGLYLVWPVFYTDVTDSYRLDRRGRLRTDLGGVYFNVLFTLGVAAAYLATGFRPLAVFLLLGQLETLRQFLPFVRLDGYYVVSDLVGVPNLFAYMGPVLLRITRRGDENARRRAEAKLANLKPWARRVITGWVCLTAPILLINAAVLLLLGPRIAGAAWGSAQLQLHDIARAHGDGDVTGLLNGLLSVALLAMPLAGTALIVAMMAKRLVKATTRWWRVRPLGTASVVSGLAVVLALQIGVVWPDTFQSALEQSQLAYSSGPPSQQANAALTPAPPTNTSSPADTSSPAARPEPATPPVLAPAPADITPPGAPTTALAPGLSPPRLEPSAPIQAAPAQPPADETGPAATWTVQPGDDLWSIAQHVQGQALGRAPTDDETSPYWRRLLEANSAALDGPDLLYADQVLTLPATVDTQPPQPAAQPPTGEEQAATNQPPSAPAQPPADETGPAATWIVQPGDDLWSIAQHVQAQALGRAPTEQETASYWTTLLTANHATLADPGVPDLLYAGQALTLARPHHPRR